MSCQISSGQNFFGFDIEMQLARRSMIFLAVVQVAHPRTWRAWRPKPTQGSKASSGHMVGALKNSATDLRWTAPAENAFKPNSCRSTYSMAGTACLFMLATACVSTPNSSDCVARVRQARTALDAAEARLQDAKTAASAAGTPQSFMQAASAAADVAGAQAAVDTAKPECGVAP